MEKLKQLFDSRATWTFIGVLSGTVFGEKAAELVGYVGLAVMAYL